MSNHFEKYLLYSSIIRRLLLFTGLWPTADPTILYRLLPFVHGLAAILASCAILNFCRHNFANLNLFLSALGLSLSYLTMIQKTICLTFYRKRLSELHACLANTFGQDLNDTELRPILLSPLLSFYQPSLILSSFTYAVKAMYMLTPLVLIAIQFSRGVDHVKYILPLPTFYPWRIDANTWLYPAHYALEVYAGICLSTFTSSIDSLFGYYVFQISGQLRTLSHRVRNLSSNKNYQKVISECVARHQILTRCQHHLEQIYGPIVLWMLVTSAMVICSLLYQATHISPGKVILIAFSMVMKSMQMLLYGWFGTFLTMENDMFREAVYASAWPGSGEKCLMTNVLIMLTYKPYVLKACSLSTISIDMFVTDSTLLHILMQICFVSVKVANTALSYFFLIRTLEEANSV